MNANRRIGIVCLLYVMFFGPGIVAAEQITVGPYPNFEGTIEQDVTVTIPTVGRVGINDPTTGDVIWFGPWGGQEIDVHYQVPLFAASYLEFETPFDPTDDITLTEIWSLSENPGHPPHSVPQLTGFNPDDPAIDPAGEEWFEDQEGEHYESETTVCTLGDLGDTLNGYDVSMFTGSADLIVYLQRATVPAEHFVIEDVKIGPYPNFEGTVEESVGIIIPTVGQVGVNDPRTGEVIWFGPRGGLEIWVEHSVPVFSASYLEFHTSAEDPFDPDAHDIILTEVWSKIDEDDPPYPVPQLTGFDPGDPEIGPVGDGVEWFEDQEGEHYESETAVCTLAELQTMLPGYDLRRFSATGRDPNSIVYVQQATVPAAGFVITAPIPTVSEWGLIIMTLLLLTAGTIVFGHLRQRQPAAA